MARADWRFTRVVLTAMWRRHWQGQRQGGQFAVNMGKREDVASDRKVAMEVMRCGSVLGKFSTGGKQDLLLCEIKRRVEDDTKVFGLSNWTQLPFTELRALPLSPSP